jgi:hypothetical protein
MLIKFGAPLDAFIGPMLAALAANPVRAPVAVDALRTLVFKIALPGLNILEICEVLLGAFTAVDDWESKAPFLLVRIIWMAADAVPVELAELAMRADPGIVAETAGQLLFVISCCMLFLPAAFANGFEGAVLEQFVEKVIARQVDVNAVDLFRISTHI